MKLLLDAPIIRNRSDGIDFMRAFFALWVMAAHLVPWSARVVGDAERTVLEQIFRAIARVFQSYGETHPAVLGFIVLSGYCIHRNGARRDNNFAMKGYALRRIFRIWPVYVLAVLVGIVLFFVSFTQDSEMAQALLGTTGISAPCVIAKLTGVSSFIPTLHVCSFQGNAPLTTAMVEIWLYVLYGVVVSLMFRGVRQTTLLSAIGAIYLAMFVVVAVLPDLRGWWHNGSVFSFALYWWIGALFVRSELPSRRFITAAIVLWVILTALLMEHTVESFVLTEMRKIVFAVMVGYAIVLFDRRQRSWYRLGSRIGLAGYSIYALHAPVLVALLVLGVPGWGAFLAVLAIAGITFVTFERPLTDLGKRFARQVTA